MLVNMECNLLYCMISGKLNELHTITLKYMVDTQLYAKIIFQSKSEIKSLEYNKI